MLSLSEAGVLAPVVVLLVAAMHVVMVVMDCVAYGEDELAWTSVWVAMKHTSDSHMVKNMHSSAAYQLLVQIDMVLDSRVQNKKNAAVTYASRPGVSHETRKKQRKTKQTLVSHKNDVPLPLMNAWSD